MCAKSQSNHTYPFSFCLSRAAGKAPNQVRLEMETDLECVLQQGAALY